MHFNGRELKCKNCEDYIASLCPGNQFETVEDCMMDKAKMLILWTVEYFQIWTNFYYLIY